jgi:hypothetical protein
MKYKIMNIKALFSTLVIVVAIVPNVGFAQVGETPFGGEITMRILCTCSLSTQLYIKNYDGKQLKLTYIPGFSMIYLSYNYLGATYLLGTYSKAMKNQCYVYNGNNCKLQSDDGALGNQPGTGFSM